jgi:glycosyltransferase involved in cell wall biosynthesis
MKIAQVAPLAESVPPKLYGGTERVVSWLTEELVALGHEVTLFASADSRTGGTLAPVWPRALRLSRPRTDPGAAQAVLLQAVSKRAREFDVIHCHLDWIHLPLLEALGARFVTTLHGRLDLPHLSLMASRFANAPFVSISNNQREPLPGLRWLGTVHHGMPVSLLQPGFQPQGYLAFLGRITPEKGPDKAIRIARAAGHPLRIAAKVPRGENQFFKREVQPLVDGVQVQFIGEVDDRSKAPFLQHATALLFPIDWPEPFGLVMIEAMACGTPVIATPHGSVPEIVEDGVTGFLVNTEAEAIAAVAQVGRLDRRRVRDEFERRFSSRRMAEDYLRLYTEVVEQPALSNVCGVSPTK